MKIKILFLVLLLIAAIQTSSAWEPGSEYRIPIEINNTGVNLTHYQYSFAVNTSALVIEGKMNADGSDCRVMDENNISQPFWNETAFNTSSTIIWVNATTLGNITNTTHYMYYGNASAASMSNGSTTFKFYDGVEYGSTNQSTSGYYNYSVGVYGDVKEWQSTDTISYRSQYYNGKTYVTYMTSEYVIKITYLNHSTGEWASPVTIATANSDGHSSPALIIKLKLQFKKG